MRPINVVLLLLGAVAGGLLLLLQVIDIKTNAVATGRDVKDVKERLARVEKSLTEIRAAQEQAQNVLERIEGRFVPQHRPQALQDRPQLEVQVVRVNPGEFSVIRDTIFDDPSAKPEMNVGARVGASVQDVSPRPVPVSLALRFPKLNGLRYVIDSNWAIALIAPKADRVVAVIPPI